MTQETLIQTLLDFRKNRINEKFEIQLSDKVSYSIAWIKNHSRFKGNQEIRLKKKQHLYLIKNNRPEYAGIVHFIEGEKDNLHWYVLDNFRHQGLLTNALNNYIIPHLFTFNETLNISIVKDIIGKENHKNSSKVAKAVGFIQVDENEYILEKKNTKFSSSHLNRYDISKKRIFELKDKLDEIDTELEIIHEELKLANIDSKSLKEIRIELDKFKRYKMEDEYEDSFEFDD